MKSVLVLLTILLTSVMVYMVGTHNDTAKFFKMSRIETIENVKTVNDTTIQQTPHTEPLTPSKVEMPKIEEPAPIIATTPTPVEPTPPPVVTPAPTTCAEELRKYQWDQKSAYDVMMTESGNRPDNQNDDPRTGDYSIGCFQINLLGIDNLRAKYRDSVANGYTGPMTVEGLEPWLKNARNNVAVAHTMWAQQGWSPWSYTTCKKVLCQ